MSFLLPKTPIIRCKRHLRWVASRPCCVCRRTDCQAAHVKYLARCKGIALKPGDDFTVPLCCGIGGCHPQQTLWIKRAGADDAIKAEEDWWRSKGVDPAVIIARLRAESPFLPPQTGAKS